MTESERFNAGAIRLDGERKQAIDVGRNRLLVTGAVLSALFVTIAARLVDVTVLQAGNELRETRNAASTRGAAARPAAAASHVLTGAHGPALGAFGGTIPPRLLLG